MMPAEPPADSGVEKSDRHGFGYGKRKLSGTLYGIFEKYEENGGKFI